MLCKMVFEIFIRATKNVTDKRELKNSENSLKGHRSYKVKKKRAFHKTRQKSVRLFTVKKTTPTCIFQFTGPFKPQSLRNMNLHS